jgi:hypothetical protein
LAGILFAHLPFSIDWSRTGQKTLFSKKPEWARIAVSSPYIVLMGSGHFARFSKIARIGKPGILRGFMG